MSDTVLKYFMTNDGELQIRFLEDAIEFVNLPSYLIDEPSFMDTMNIIKRKIFYEIDAVIKERQQRDWDIDYVRKVL